ncbi:hypothetical protein C8R46DRAFT_902658, partial [Mycena filopes]
GGEWSDLVTKYLEFEKACGYQDEGPRIGGSNKPTEIGWWIGRARNEGRGIGDGGSFADNWWLWWKSLQPSERTEEIEGTGMLTFPMKMTWGRLATLYGRNGFMQVMAALLWWGLALRGEEQKEGWLAAVADVECILHGIIESGEAK